MTILVTYWICKLHNDFYSDVYVEAWMHKEEHDPRLCSRERKDKFHVIPHNIQVYGYQVHGHRGIKRS